MVKGNEVNFEWKWFVSYANPLVENGFSTNIDICITRFKIFIISCVARWRPVYLKELIREREQMWRQYFSSVAFSNGSV